MSDYYCADYPRVTWALRQAPAQRAIRTELVDAWVEWGRHPWWWQLIHRRPRAETR